MHIILALDSSDDARQSLSFLKKIPFKEKPSVTVVTALQRYPYPFHRIPESMLEQLRETEEGSARKSFDEAVSKLGSLCESVDHVTERKQPAELILEVAKDRQADLIVMGARGHSAIYRVFLGSSADHVVNSAQCSVLVVRHPDEAGESATDDTFRVLVAYDGSPHADIAVAQMKRLNWQAKHALIHLAMMHERPGMLPEEVIYDADIMADSERMLSKLGSELGVSCEVTHSAAETYHIGNALTSKIDHEGFDLLYVGTSSRSGLSRALLGSTSRYLLHHAKCSVWIAREKKW